MAHSLSAKKRIRQNLKNRARNRWRLRALRDTVRAFLDKLAHGTAAEAKTEYVKMVQVIDRTASKGIIHKNNAARRKSRLNARLKAKALGTTKPAQPTKSSGPAKAAAKAGTKTASKPAPKTPAKK